MQTHGMHSIRRRNNPDRCFLSRLAYRTMKICLLFALVAALVSAAVVYITAPKPFHYVPATDVNWMQVGASPGIEHSRHPAVTGDAVVPFRIHVADTVLDDLSHRLDTAILPSSPVSDVFVRVLLRDMSCLAPRSHCSDLFSSDMATQAGLVASTRLRCADLWSTGARSLTGRRRRRG